MKKILYTISCCLASLIATGQNDHDFSDSEDPGRARQGFPKDSSAQAGPVVPHFRTAWRWMHGGVYKQPVLLDSLADGIHNYNVIFKRDVSNTYLGNFPSPYESNIFIHREKGEDFYPLNTVRAYLFKPEDALEFNVTTPFTRLDYFNGGPKSKSENWLDVWHVQNIKPYWSAGLRYQLISSGGSYTYQKSQAYNFAIFSSYEKRRVAASFFMNQNMGHFNENGGISNPEEIRDTIMNSLLVLTRLNYEPSNNYKNFNLHALVQYNIGKGKKVEQPRDTVTAPVAEAPPRQGARFPDAATRDSLINARLPDSLRSREGLPDSLLLAARHAVDSLAGATGDTTEVQDSVYLGAMTYPMKATLSVRVEENKHSFKEEQVEGDFFPYFYIDSLKHYNLYKNSTVEIAGKLIVNEHPKYVYLPGVYAGLTYKHLNYLQRKRVDRDSTTVDFDNDGYSATYLTAGIFNIDSTALFRFDASGNLCLLGDYLGDYDLRGEVSQFLRRDKEMLVKVKAALTRGTPNPFLRFYLGNHDRWENRFNKIAAYELEGSFHHSRYRSEAGVGLSNTTGYIYFDTLGTPRQYEADLFVLTAWVKQLFKAGNFFFDQTVYYQVSNKPGVLSLPLVSLYSHNYYRNTFFKKALGFQAGVDLFYNTAFFASAYAPSIMQFHNQRRERTGNYPKIDVFVALRIKRADIFVKVEHVSHYFANRDYFSAYTYPINPLRVKYGVRWNFFD
jgi:hypothetical protein